MPNNRSGKGKLKKRQRDESDLSELEGLDEDFVPEPSNAHADDLEDDEREIRRLEKLLGLNKRWKRKKGKKSESDDSSRQKLPPSFKDMGLDYLLKPIMKSSLFDGRRREEDGEVKHKKKKRSEDDEPEEQESSSEEKVEVNKKSLYTEDADSGHSSNDEGDETKSRKLTNASSDDSQRLARRAMALMNRLSEPTVPPLFSETRQLYTSGSFPRAAISNALCDAAMATCVTKPAFVVPDKVSSPVAILFALLRVTGCASDAVGQLIHRLTWLLAEYNNARGKLAKQLRESPKLENAVRLLSHLLLFRSLDSVLLLDILKMFGLHICQSDSKEFDAEKAEFAASLTISLLRTAGPALRKNDPSGLAAAIKEVQDAASNARSRTEVSNGSRLSFLAEVITAVRNNNFAKIPGYEAEESTRFAKLFSRLKTELSAHESANDSPFRVSFSALASFGESGSNWWLKADTCSGPMVLAGKISTKQDKVKKQEVSAEGNKHREMAQKLHLNTDVRRSIFSVIISSTDIDDAIERLIKLPLRSELQRTEAVPVAFQCCLKERNYNPFYGQLLARLCAQETDKKQRLFRLAVKKSFTERLSVETGSENLVANTAKLCVDLIRLNAISFITALRCVDFTMAAPGSPTYAFLHAVFDTFFHPSKLEESSFRRIVVDPLLSAQAKNGRKLASSLLLFAKHMYDSGKMVALGSEDDEISKEKRMSMKGCGKYTLAELRPRLDLLSAEIV